MKHAYLILVHNNYTHLERLIKKINFEKNDIYIHLDKKSDISLLEKKIKHPNVFFIPDRYKVYWGGWSMVKATMSSLSYILNKGNYSYIHLMSGSDYLIQSSSEVYNFFENSNNKQFLCYEKITKTTPADWTDSMDRIHFYFFNDLKERFIRNPKVDRVVRVVLRRFNRTFIYRKFPDLYVPYCGSQWWSLTGDCVQYLCNHYIENDDFTNYFKYVHCPDEIYFQTILLNSEFKDRIVNNNMRYIDWSEKMANPKKLIISDYEAIVNSGSLFARKFNLEEDKEILDRLDGI